MALAMLIEGETVTAIATALNVSRTTLYAMPKFGPAVKRRRLMVQLDAGRGPRRGHRGADRSFEAYDDES
jgi:hypothetical protein